MSILINFSLAFSLSFVGSIPPGTINLTLLQLGLQNKIKTAFKFALAACAIDYPYAWIAVKFEKLIMNSAYINENLHILASLVMIILGIISVWPVSKTPSLVKIDFSNSGFRRGILLGILNPLAIPYWVAMTAFLRSENLIGNLDSVDLHAYLLGVFLGALCFLTILILLSKKLIGRFAQNQLLKRIPGILLLILGFISLARYFGSL
jgi:threonine/homoserine/homoserine lactone efflux protein